MASIELRAGTTLPEDGDRGALAGRVWRPDVGGPSVVAIRDGKAIDITAAYPTVRDLAETPDPAVALRDAVGIDLGPLERILANTPIDTRDTGHPWMLAPADLQAVKAAGVTFVVSMLERVIEEQARGVSTRAVAIRAEITQAIGGDLRGLKPGSEAAAALKALLVKKGLSSQYLEVGIGPDAEIFTKAQPMASVGTGQDAGIHPASTWNNPEPEIVLVVASSGAIVGATLGNDVNLRDVEGRSALLLGKAKDNNASSAIGPFIRFFDATFTLDDLRRADVTLTVEGTEGFRMEGRSSIAQISRDPADLAAQMIGPHHDYPDGALLYLGTMFAPTDDRGAPGMGFTHKDGDIVTIATPKLGRLINRIRPCDQCERWKFGAGALMRNLAARGLLA